MEGRNENPITMKSEITAAGASLALVVNWTINAKHWPHLDGIKFPEVGSRPVVDLLIGIDYAYLHHSLKDVYGCLGEPFATPLGWTYIGSTRPSLHSPPMSEFARTSFLLVQQT
ncbi:hypothetical protein SNE40_001570 [Patella caerulea]|uniref:Uncharacterized protein n=1 Tax=Patella caerulea TaxID=87958 RepID=A0AAN8KEU0_PATCE